MLPTKQELQYQDPLHSGSVSDGNTLNGLNGDTLRNNIYNIYTPFRTCYNYQVFIIYVSNYAFYFV